MNNNVWMSLSQWISLSTVRNIIKSFIEFSVRKGQAKNQYCKAVTASKTDTILSITIDRAVEHLHKLLSVNTVCRCNHQFKLKLNYAKRKEYKNNSQKHILHIFQQRGSILKESRCWPACSPNLSTIENVCLCTISK